MSYNFKIGLFSFALLALIMHNCVVNPTVAKMEVIETSYPSGRQAVEPTATVTTADDTIFEDYSEITRQVLITHCGSCHQSSLETHKAGAIAVFDLDKNADWHDALTQHELPGIENRLQNKSTITKEQKEAIAAFLKLKATQLGH